MSQTAADDQTAEFETRLQAELDRRFAVTPALLHSIDAKGQLISLSDAWLAKLGYQREELIGRRSSDLLTPASREHAIRNVLPEFFRTGRCDNVEYQVVCKDGHVIDILLSGVVEKAIQGQGPVSIAVITDVTALKRVERQLAESEARYRSLVEDQSELVSLANPNGELRYVNPAYAAFYGKQPGEFVGRNLFDLASPDDRPGLKAHLRQVCASHCALENKNKVVRPGGETCWIAWSNRALRDVAGRVTAIHSVGRDIDREFQSERRLQESEARYRFLANNSTDLIVLVDHDGKRQYASPACRRMLGYEPEEMLEIRTPDAIHPEDRERVLAALGRRYGGETGAEHTLTYRMRRKNGTYAWVETTGRAVDMQGQDGQRLVIIRDVGQRMLDEARLKASEARYRLLADNSTDMVVQLDGNFVHQYVSPASREILGYEPEELLGTGPVGMVHPEDAGRVTLVFQSLMNGACARHNVINRIRHRDGRWVWVEAQLRALSDAPGGEPTGIIGALRDISLRKAIEDELAAANHRLRELADKDSLTSLPNRRVFDEMLVAEHRRALRERTSLALIMIDVDRFKEFNDLYGHPAGDECLRRIGTAIAGQVLRPGDLACRYGGEEFAVLLPNTDESSAAIVAERIRAAVADLKIPHAQGVSNVMTISAGVASTRPTNVNQGAEAMTQSADLALYRAKHDGRNRVFRYSDMNSVTSQAGKLAS
jgi:diguanylate cyclase (GGDEF)-like protein/PAS domain S-box-containing protein